MTGYGVLGIASMTWSANSIATGLAAADLLLMTAAMLYSGCALRSNELLELLARAMSIAMVAHWIGLLAIAGSRVDDFGSLGWSGLLRNENDFGRQAVFASIVLFSASKSARPGYAVLAMLSVASALMSGSVQVIVVLTFVIMVVQISRFANAVGTLRNTVACLLLASVAVIAYLARNGVNAALTASGKDSTLTSRVPLWQALQPQIESHWLTGFGLNNVWDRPEVWYPLTFQAQFRPFQAHNSYLEAGMQLGVPGMVLLITALGVAGRIAWLGLAVDPTLGSLSVAIVSAGVLYSFSASIFGRAPVEIYWLLLAVVVTCMQSQINTVTEVRK